MPEHKETLRDKLVLAFVQTLIFGVLLAVFGYWLDSRLEAYKQELAVQTEKTKVLLSSLEPHIQQRRTAYLEFQQAARRVRDLLEVYYFRAEGPTQRDARRHELSSLENELGIGSGMGGGGSFTNSRHAVSVVRDLIVLREQHEDVSSDKVNTALDDFIESVMEDLKDGAKESNKTEAFHTAAVRRLHEGFEKLNIHIEQALGIEHSPVE